MTEDDVRTHVAPRQHKLGGTIHALHQLMRAYGYIQPEQLPVVAIVFNISVAEVRGIASIGPPSSLAIELASSHGMTLIGFLKADRFNVYAGGAIET